MDLTGDDARCFLRAIELADEAGAAANLPIGAVVSLDGGIIAEGRNGIWFPGHSPDRHAEVDALRGVPQHLWDRSEEMTLHTTLEPCLMCLGAILLHRIGRVLYGAADAYGGASQVIGNLPVYFKERAAAIEWIGPAYPEACNPLCERVLALVERRGRGELRAGR